MRNGAARRSYGGGDAAPFLVPGADTEGGSTISVPVRLSGFNWPIAVSALGSNTTITLTNGMTSETGADYLKEHLTFLLSNNLTLSIDSEAGETENEFFLTDGSSRYNELTFGATPGVYAFNTAPGGPTLVAALWDGVRFDPAS